MFEEILQNVAAKAPLVHCITNYVTVNDCANILLACGGSPIMADDENEVEEITSICNALVLNIGTLNTRTIESMRRAGLRANALGHPVVFDPVGAGASALRTGTAQSLLRDVRFCVVRGNSSEIRTLARGAGTTRGVDADAADAATEQTLDDAVLFVKTFSRQTGAVVAMTGAIDLVGDAETCYIIRNGCPEMGKITGTSVNPARSIGPALFEGGGAISQLWLFIVAPLTGGLASAIVWKAISQHSDRQR